MTVQGCRVELREDENPAHVGVEAVADRYVNQAVFARNGHRWFRSELRQGEEPFALAAPENDRKNFVVHSHLGTEC